MPGPGLSSDIENVSPGKHDDVDRLYRGRASVLIDHFTGRARDADLASDIVQEAFARFAAIGRAKRETLTRPDSYLYSICLNLFRDRARQASERNMTPPSYETFQDPIAHLESRDSLRRLESAILRLKPKTREIFLARRLDGLTYAEIADRTGLSVKGVEKQMAKAVAQIDRMLDRH